MKAKKAKIPKIIHQIWLGPKEPPVQWMETWKKLNPSWEYKLWTEDNLPPLYNQKQFDMIQKFSGKADIARVEILYKWGGLYLDADCECLTPLDDELCNPSLFACYENELLRPGLIATGVIGCQPKHGLMAAMIEKIAEIDDLNQQEPWTVVGPFLFTRMFRLYEIGHGFLTLLPSYQFYPIHYLGMRYRGQGKIYGTHHWSTTTNKPYHESKFNQLD